MSEIKEIIKQLKETDLTELRVEDGDFKFAVKRDAAFAGPVSPAAVDDSTDTAASRAAPAVKKRMPIKSPMVGRFFNSPAADRPPLVMKGNHVEYGQKVGAVEAMKIFKDVVSPVKGVIVEVMIENNTPVEYAQELFLVEIEE